MPPPLLCNDGGAELLLIQGILYAFVAFSKYYAAIALVGLVVIIGSLYVKDWGVQMGALLIGTILALAGMFELLGVAPKREEVSA